MISRAGIPFTHGPRCHSQDSDGTACVSNGSAMASAMSSTALTRNPRGHGGLANRRACRRYHRTVSR